MLDTLSFKNRLYGIIGGFQTISRPGQLLQESCLRVFKDRWTNGEQFPICIPCGTYPSMPYEEWAAGCLVQQLESLGFAAHAVLPPESALPQVIVEGYSEPRCI